MATEEDAEAIDTRLAALEEHRNALQLAWMALALRFDSAGRESLIESLRQAASAMAAKQEMHGADLLRTMADALTRTGGGGPAGHDAGTMR